MEKTPKIIRVYDNGGKTQDRYTVYYGEPYERSKTLYDCLTMDKTPFYPLGFCQHLTGCLGRHNGKQITVKDLPKDCQAVLKNEGLI